MEQKKDNTNLKSTDLINLSKWIEKNPFENKHDVDHFVKYLNAQDIYKHYQLDQDLVHQSSVEQKYSTSIKDMTSKINLLIDNTLKSNKYLKISMGLNGFFILLIIILILI